uniref:BamA/TamA family outer membrane protein n=1 Tax=Roseihalotalea indica TaxID=2867963 RepID=A0AA49JHK0_9BACT|nr:BamA/TamA family outer membrane protein [Tunicatimonas sp. TK19036]
MRIFLLGVAYWLILGSGVTYAQWQVQVNITDEEKKIAEPYFPSTQHETLASAQTAVAEMITSLQQSGYFQAYATPLPPQDSLLYAVELSVGNPFHWAYLKPGNLDAALQAQSGYREQLFLQQPFHYADFQQMVENCLDYSEEHGFPFASVRLKDIDVEDQAITATLDYQSGPLIRFGELNIIGADNIKPEFLEAYLGVRTGTVYSEKKVAQITSRLQLLPFLTLDGPVETRFQNEVADLYLPLTVQPSNQIDGVLSVLPDVGRDDRKLLLTGELNILLRNLAKSGKTFFLHWQRLQVASQQLSISYDHPNLLRSPFGFGFNFNLLKEDILFLNRKANLSASYLTGKNHRITLFGDWRASRLTGERATMVGNGSSDFADVSVHGGGLQYDWTQVDQLLFPRRGYAFTLMGRSGRKTVSFWKREGTQNDQLIYQTQVSPQWASEFSFTQYYMFGSNLGISHQIQGAALLDNSLFLNELYRLGGLKSLRGFADNWFYASQYALSKLELRWLLEPEIAIPSYLFAFYDQAWMRQQYHNKSNRDYPTGIGAGVSISTRAGLFSLAYALGKSKNQAMSLSTSKVHFGYISRF